MAYNQNIPQPTTNLSVSQGDLLANFQQLDTSFAKDHTAFSVSTNFGQHKQMTFPTTTTAAAQSLLASIIYPKTGIGTQLNAAVPFIRNKNADYPLMPDIVVVSGSFGFQLGELKISMGATGIAGGAGSTTQTLPYTYSSVYTALANINKASPFGAFGARSIYTSVSGATLTLIIEAANAAGVLPVYYLVIGA